MKTDHTPQSAPVVDRRLNELTRQVEDLQKQLQEARQQPVRMKLPATRKSVTHDFKIGAEINGVLTVGLNDDGRLGEIFVKMAKQGSTIGGLMNAVSIVTSISLQHGVPIEVLVEKLSHTRFEPSGPTGNPEIPFAKSPVDYIFRWLGQFGTQSEVNLGKSNFPPRVM